MTAITLGYSNTDERTYKRRIRAWTMYDWANSAFATTIMAALLPVYFSGVAGKTLPSEATATAYWSMALSLSLLVSAILAPILGTVSDVMRGKKKFLAVFIGMGVLGTGLLVFVSTGDWFLASLLFIFGRIGFAGANVFYDALLPHVARPEEQDSVSARGYAMGYLGGGLLLAVNIVMVQMIPDSWFEYAGVRLSFLSVGVWWAVFSIPILRQVPEPPAASADLQPGETIIGVSFKRLHGTLSEVRQYRELFKYLLAFLLYNDAINTIIGMAAIYGAELGFGMLELVGALLLVQFVGIPFSLIFGRLPDGQNSRRHLFLAFIVFSLVMLPVVSVAGRVLLATDATGNRPQPYTTTNGFYGEGEYPVTDSAAESTGDWQTVVVPGADLTGKGIFGRITTLFTGTPDDATYALANERGAAYTLAFNGQKVTVTYDMGPDRGILTVYVNGESFITPDDDGELRPLTIDTYSKTVRYNVEETITLDDPGHYTLSLVNSGVANPDSTGTQTAITQFEVLKPVRKSNLMLILGILSGVQVAGVVFARLFGERFRGLAETLDTRRSILLALVIYSMIAVWGFFLNSAIEYWFLAWSVAIVQGGSQALSRSLYASLSPAAKSGEFFGLYDIMAKMAAFTGPLVFALAVLLFGSSRPAVLSLVLLFVIGGVLLARVDIEAGQRHAKEEDARYLGVAAD